MNGGENTVMLFQFTPLREGRRVRESLALKRTKHFNSRPSARGDKHSSTRTRYMFDFNSRPSARGDAMPIDLSIAPSVISIHAPPRGATIATMLFASDVYFNSRPSARGDNVPRLRCTSRILFQFTPLREGRRGEAIKSTDAWNFNSRPSARGDGRAS